MNDLTYFERETRSALLGNMQAALRLAILRLADNDVDPDMFMIVRGLAAELPSALAKDDFDTRWQIENMLATFLVIDPMVFKNNETLRTAGIERLRIIYEEIRALTLKVAA